MRYALLIALIGITACQAAPDPWFVRLDTEASFQELPDRQWAPVRGLLYTGALRKLETASIVELPVESPYLSGWTDGELRLMASEGFRFFLIRGMIFEGQGIRVQITKDEQAVLTYSGGDHCNRIHERIWRVPVVVALKEPPAKVGVGYDCDGP